MGATDKYNETMDKVALYIDRLNSLITELLYVSRIQSGYIDLHQERFNFDTMISEAIENLGTSISSHKINLIGKVDIEVLGDESHLVQVVNNLISNGIKYAPHSSEVQVYVSKVSEYVKVSVTDYGLGISAEDQKRIFERFFRGGDVQKRFPGMGIGLYVCYQIIKNHGGTIWVDSQEGKGSTFSFTIPINGRANHE